MAIDRHVRRAGDAYRDAFLELLPQGQAWPKHTMESVLWQVCDGLCNYWGFVDSRAADLLERESDPRQTVELLPDWERAFGLPDPCYKTPSTIPDRQAALVQRMTLWGAQSRDFFINIAASIGYHITIGEFRPFMVGIDRAGDNRTYLADGVTLSDYPYMIGVPENRFYWTVHVGDVRLTWFRASAGQAGVDPHLRIALATDLECLLNRLKPAHTQIVYDYSGLGRDDPMAGTP
jgi:uncharacterized protein YmfQ (DUF2313 family)